MRGACEAESEWTLWSAPVYLSFSGCHRERDEASLLLHKPAGATLMWICGTPLGKGLVSAGEVLQRRCLLTDKIITGEGRESSLHIKGGEGSGGIGSCW